MTRFTSDPHLFYTPTVWAHIIRQSFSHHLFTLMSIKNLHEFPSYSQKKIFWRTFIIKQHWFPLYVHKITETFLKVSLFVLCCTILNESTNMVTQLLFMLNCPFKTNENAALESPSLIFPALHFYRRKHDRDTANCLHYIINCHLLHCTICASRKKNVMKCSDNYGKFKLPLSALPGESFSAFTPTQISGVPKANMRWICKVPPPLLHFSFC